MSSVEEILRKSIEDKCGLGGLMRFNATYTGDFETTDGKPDIPGISAAINNAFPADQAAIIVAAVTKKLELQRLTANSDGKAPDVSPGESQEVLPAFAMYFNADPNHVRDIVDEARRMRVAMGKSVPSQWAPHPDKVAENKMPEENAPAETARTEKVTEVKIAIEAQAKPQEADRPLPVKPLASPAAPVVARQPSRNATAEPLSPIDEEIRQFVYGRTACTSIDIIDFIRYLKDKEYSLQEYIVLEKIYVRIEERKKEARFAIEKEIEGLIDETQTPGESDIRGLLRRLCEAGLVFEEEDVRRMIRGAVLRRA
jgi:hypothetical protein